MTPAPELHEEEMLHYITLILAVITAFTLGSLFAPRPPSLTPSLQLISAPEPFPPAPPQRFAQGPLGWRHLNNWLFSRYRPRSPIGTLVISLRDPEIRSTAIDYLDQAWNQVKDSTATISPEAAEKLRDELEPFARKTLLEIENRCTE